MTGPNSTTATSVFVDSTTLIYLLDRSEPAKRQICAAWLKALIRAGKLTLNLQVLNETYWALRRKPRLGVTTAQARRLVRLFLPYARAPLSPALIPDAWALEDAAGAVYFDAMLLSAARKAGCSHFLSEDLNDGQVYGGVTVVNPFRHSPEDVLGRAPQKT